MKMVPLSQGKYALVDIDDYDLVMAIKWFAHRVGNRWYADGNLKDNGKWRTVRMHRLIMPPPQGFEIDHMDRNGLNNQRYNLRICTRRQNCINRRGWGKTSKYKGVYVKSNKFIAVARQDSGDRVYLGSFDDEQQAALAYNQFAQANYGQFASLNQIEDTVNE